MGSYQLNFVQLHLKTKFEYATSYFKTQIDLSPLNFTEILKRKIIRMLKSDNKSSFTHLHSCEKKRLLPSYFHSSPDGRKIRVK